MFVFSVSEFKFGQTYSLEMQADALMLILQAQ